MTFTTMKIEIVSREAIKPSFPTPKHLRNYQLSFIDQTAPAIYTPLLFFYAANADTDSRVMKGAERSQHLKTSLSKMLTELYPLAGRIIDKTIVECNDQGAEYVEARVNCHLSDILQRPDPPQLRNFLPVAIESPEAETGGRLLVVQSTLFECGGMVIGVCISHKIADGSALSTVIKAWSATALAGYCDAVKFPEFNAASLFPPVLDSCIASMQLIEDPKAVTKRFVFESSKIAELKAKAASATVQQPTRVKVVTALIWKCMIHVSRSTKGFPRLSMISQAANLREKIVPPLPQNSIGNIVGMFFAAHSTENEIDLKGLVCKVRKEKIESSKTALQTITQEKKAWLQSSGINFAERDDIEFRIFTSWCRFPFYEADFGWGKPTWVTVPSVMVRNAVVMMDSRDGEGIEATVILGKEDMALLEQEQELLEFAALNPSIC